MIIYIIIIGGRRLHQQRRRIRVGRCIRVRVEREIRGAELSTGGASTLRRGLEQSKGGTSVVEA